MTIYTYRATHCGQVFELQSEQKLSFCVLASTRSGKPRSCIDAACATDSDAQEALILHAAMESGTLDGSTFRAAKQKLDAFWDKTFLRDVKEVPGKLSLVGKFETRDAALAFRKVKADEATYVAVERLTVVKKREEMRLWEAEEWEE